MQYMSLFRFEQIKRYLHLSSVDCDTAGELWYRKLFSLANQLRSAYKEFVSPSQNAIVNQMMIRFQGYYLSLSSEWLAQNKANKDHGP